MVLANPSYDLCMDNLILIQWFPQGPPYLSSEAACTTLSYYNGFLKDLLISHLKLYGPPYHI